MKNNTNLDLQEHFNALSTYIREFNVPHNIFKELLRIQYFLIDKNSEILFDLESNYDIQFENEYLWIEQLQISKTYILNYLESLSPQMDITLALAQINAYLNQKESETQFFLLTANQYKEKKDQITIDKQYFKVITKLFNIDNSEDNSMENEIKQTIKNLEAYI